MKSIMRNKALLKAAATSLLLTGTMVGCSTVGGQNRVASISVKQTTKAAIAAEAALARKDGVRAVAAAETAVAGDPQNAAYRTLLGRAYLLAGRYASAETTLLDAMTLGATDGRTIVSLALVQVGSGKVATARTLLEANRNNINAVDFGLAIALAGDTQEGVRVLNEVIADPSSGAKGRQNLAYAYALNGNWREASLMARQDLSPEVAQARIASWAATAAQGAEPQRIAALIGVTPRSDDTGLPVRLALAAPGAQAVQMAAADPAPEAAPQSMAADQTPAEPTAITSFAEATPDTAPTPVAEAAPTPVQLAQGAQAIKDGGAIPAPIIRAPATPVRTAFIPAATPAAAVRNASFQPVTGNSSAFVVQLGAYDSAAVAREKWFQLAGGNADIARFPVVRSSVTLRGKLFHRVAMTGFASQQSANEMCHAIRAQGGRCFVRAGDRTAKPERWALAKQRVYASR